MKNLSNLLQIRAFEQLKSADTPEERMRLIREGGLPHEVVTPFIKTSGEWKVLAKQMPIFALLRHLNTLRRHGCFGDPEFTNEIAAKLKKEDNITKSKIWPFRFYDAYKMLKKESREEYYPERDYLPGKPKIHITVEKELLLPEFFEKPREVERFSTATPQTILDALAHAYATSFKNLPEINGATVAIVDVSGSMEGKYMEIAATLGLGLLAKCTEKRGIICFSSELYPVQIAPNPLDVVENIINLPHGGTNLSLPIQYLTQNEVKADNIVVLSDMEEWMDEGFMESLRRYRSRVNGKAKAFLINVSPYRDYPTPSDEPEVYPIAGWSENIIGFISLATRAEEQTKAVEDIVV